MGSAGAGVSGEGRFLLLSGGMPVRRYADRDEADREARETNAAIAKHYPKSTLRLKVVERDPETKDRRER